MEIKLVTSSVQAEKVIDFLCGPNAFHWELSEGEKDSIQERVTSALNPAETTKYWFYEDNGEVIGAGAVEKLVDTNEGYFLGWFAVHKNFRKQGLGKKIIEKVEQFVRDTGGRFITVDTGEDNPAQGFYEKVGYQRVGFIPEYFEDKVGKVIFYKKLI